MRTRPAAETRCDRLVERQVYQVKERVQDPRSEASGCGTSRGRPPRQEHKEPRASHGRGARHSGSIISAAARGIPPIDDRGLRSGIETNPGT